MAQECLTVGENLLTEPFVIRDGCVEVPTKPGLGIDVDMEKLSALTYDGSWRTPEWRHRDGSVAEW